MLLNLHKQNWTDGLLLKDFEEHSKQNEESVKVCYRFLASLYVLSYISMNATELT